MTTVVVASTVVVVSSVVGDAVTSWVSTAVEPPLSASTTPVIDRNASRAQAEHDPGMGHPILRAHQACSSTDRFRLQASVPLTTDYRQAKEAN